MFTREIERLLGAQQEAGGGAGRQVEAQIGGAVAAFRRRVAGPGGRGEPAVAVDRELEQQERLAEGGKVRRRDAQLAHAVAAGQRGEHQGVVLRIPAVEVAGDANGVGGLYWISVGRGFEAEHHRLPRDAVAHQRRVFLRGHEVDGGEGGAVFELEADFARRLHAGAEVNGDAVGRVDARGFDQLRRAFEQSGRVDVEHPVFAGFVDRVGHELVLVAAFDEFHRAHVEEPDVPVAAQRQRIGPGVPFPRHRHIRGPGGLVAQLRNGLQSGERARGRPEHGFLRAGGLHEKEQQRQGEGFHASHSTAEGPRLPASSG